MGAASQGLFAGEPEVTDGSRAIAAIPEMTCELIRIGVGLSSVRFHERLADDAMQPRAPAGRDTSIHRFSINGMDKTESRCDGAPGPLEPARVPDECSPAGESRAT